MNSNNAFPDSILKEITEKSYQLKNSKLELNKELERVNTAYNFYLELNHYINKGWYFHILELFRKNTEITIIRKNDLMVNHTLLEKIKNIAIEQSKLLMKRFPTYLEKLAIEKNIPIDKKSRHPRYTLKDGFFRLEINEKRGTAQLSNNEGDLAEFPADPAAFYETYKKEENRIFEREFNGEEFLKKLRHHYLVLIDKAKKKDGDSLPIRNITTRLGKNVKGFRTDEFLIDLSKLIKNGPYEIDGYKVDLQQTKNTKQGMMLHGDAGRGYVGYILFRRI